MEGLFKDSYRIEFLKRWSMWKGLLVLLNRWYLDLSSFKGRIGQLLL